MQKTLKVGLVQQQAWPDKARSLEASVASAATAVTRSSEEVAKSAERTLETASAVLGDEQRSIASVVASIESLVGAMKGQGDRIDDIDQKLGHAFDVYASKRTHNGPLPADPNSPPLLCASIPTTSTTSGVVYLHGHRPFDQSEADAVESVARRAGASLSANRWRVDFELLFSSTIDAIMNTIQAKDFLSLDVHAPKPTACCNSS